MEALLKSQNHWKLKYQLALIYANRNRMEESKKLLVSCGGEPDFAPFYVMRAEVNKGGNTYKNEFDLQKALSLDGHWRYVKLLAEYFNTISKPENALPVVEKYYLTNPSQYIIGVLYAKTLLLNKKYAAADKVLGKLHVIPFEGATEARDIYREVKLMQAWEMMQSKKYDKALAFIQQAKLYPDHLGTGKPYENEIDFRIEYWMSYLCYSNMNKKKEAYDVLNKIIDFFPNPATTGGNNFSIANDLATAWAFDKLYQHDKWIERINKDVKNREILIMWYKAFLDKKKIDFSMIDKNVSVRMLELLINEK
jgi:tetratricopeptide (TPR) repeat protein